MNIPQETIVAYLKKKHLAISKSSTNEDIKMFEFLQENGLMSGTTDHYISNTNEGNHFLGNSNIFNPVPLNVDDWKMAIVEKLKNGEIHLDGWGKLFNQAKLELKQEGIIDTGRKAHFDTLTSKGRQYLISDLRYNDFLSNTNHPISLKIGHDFHGDVTGNQSDFSINALNRSNIQPISTHTKQSMITSIFKWILKNIVQIIITVIATAIAYYLGFTKNK